MRDSRGFIYSAALHGLLLLLLVVGLPIFSHEVDVEPEAISVDILPIAPISNVKPQDNAPKEHTQKEETAPKPHPETQVKDEPKEEPVPLPVKAKEVVKRPPPKKQPPKPKAKPKEDPLKSIFEGVRKEAAKEGPKATKSATDTSKQQAKSTHYDPGAPLSMSQKDAIRQQIESNWNAPVGAKDAANLKVSLHIELAQDGTVIKCDFTGSQSRYNSDPFFRAAVDSAKRAVDRASPLKNLPPEKYNVRDGWSEIDIDFDPRELN